MRSTDSSLLNYNAARIFLANYITLCWRRWLSGTILASPVLDSTGFWIRISARTPIRNITTGGDITGGFCPGAGFPSCHKSIYRVSEDNFRGSACVSEWMLISVKRRENAITYRFHELINITLCRSWT
jgi:hypothetical protein